MNAQPQAKRTWVESHLNCDLTDFQRDCVQLLCSAMNTGVYNIQCNWNKVEWNYGFSGVAFVVSHSDWSTFDFDRLTRLVIGAHDQCIRVNLSPVAPGRMRIAMFQRERTGQMSVRHPAIEDAIANYRSN